MSNFAAPDLERPYVERSPRHLDGRSAVFPAGQRRSGKKGTIFFLHITID